MKTIWRLLFILVFLGTAVFAWLQWKTLSGLRAENRQLTLRLQEAKSSAEADFDRKLTQLDTEIEQLRLQIKELPRLRSQVQLLRKATNEVAKLQAENQKLKSNKPNSAPVSTASLGNVQTGIPVLKENWAFAGYATPEAALQSAMWAIREGDANAFLSSMAPQERVKMEKKMADKTDGFSNDAKKEAERMIGFTVMERNQISSDRVMLKVQLGGGKNTKDIFFDQVGNEWKMSDSKDK